MQSFKKFCQRASNLTESSPEYYRLSHDLERFRSLVRSAKTDEARFRALSFGFDILLGYELENAKLN